MAWLVVKVIISAILIVIVSEIANQMPRLGALLLTLPLISIIAFILTWSKSHDMVAISKLATETLILVPLSDHLSWSRKRLSWAHQRLARCGQRDRRHRLASELLKQLKLSDNESIKSNHDGPTRVVGKVWDGPEPQFRNLRWQQ